jgi:uncharacterized small protein (DUF1192 family)
MDTDDLEPRKTPTVKKDLERMSITDLQEYIQELKAEIARTEAAIAKKNRARQGAEGFFKN